MNPRGTSLLSTRQRETIRGNHFVNILEIWCSLKYIRCFKMNKTLIATSSLNNDRFLTNYIFIYSLVLLYDLYLDKVIFCWMLNKHAILHKTFGSALFFKAVIILPDLLCLLTRVITRRKLKNLPCASFYLSKISFSSETLGDDEC